MEQLRPLRIVVASPKDVKSERNALDRVVAELNRGVAADRRLELKVGWWETDAYPGFHERGPQGLLDPVLNIEGCDILVGIFWKRFGTPTEDGRTGTEYEIETAYEAWKKSGRPQIFVYFNQQPATPQTVEEAEQWTRVLKFRESFPREGLWWPYTGKAEFEKLVRQHLSNFIRRHFPLAEPPAAGPPATPAERGSAAHRTTAELEALYLGHLLEQVGKVFIFGERRDLKKVFVELNVVEEYERPLMQAEYLDIMAAQLQRQDIFESEEKSEEAEAAAQDRDKRKRVIRPDELLRGRTRAVITGTPGCGKTTLVKYLALRADEARRLFPVFLELKVVTEDALRKAGHNLADLLFELAAANRVRLEGAEAQSFRQYFYSRLAAHEAVICLDGLDEVGDPALLSQICNCVSSFLNDPYGDNTVIITTRTYALQRIDGMKQMEIAPLTRLQVEEFLDHYYGGDPATTSLLKAFRRRTQLRELMRVPFLLAVIFQLHRTKNIIVENRLELYRQITYQLARNLDREKAAVRRSFLINDPEGSLKLDFLSHLACARLFVEDPGGEGADPESARLVFTGAAILNKAKEFVEESRLAHVSPYDLAADVKATALLREVGADIYAFAHLTIQEYLAALKLKERADAEALFCRAHFNPAMAEGEALPMLLGMVGDPARFYAMLEGLPESLTFVNLRLRARGLGYVSRLDAPSLSALADRLIPFVTQRHVEDTPFEQAVRRGFAAAAGGPLEAITGRVIAALLNSGEQDLRLRAVAVLEQLGGEGALAALVGTLEGRGRRVPPPGGTPPGSLSLEYGPEPVALRVRVAEALGRMGGEASARVLVKALKDTDRYVRYAAADALGQIGGERAAAPLLAAFKSSDVEMRRRAGEALVRMGGEHAAGALSAIIEDGYPPSVAEKAAAALGRGGGEKAVGVLLKALDSGDHGLRLAAVGALGQAGGEQAVEALLGALRHRDVDVKTKAARELGALGGARALSALVEAVREEDFYVRAGAAAALGEVGGERALEVLAALLEDASEGVRAAAVEALGRVGDEGAAGPLAAALKDPHVAIRLKAVESLRRMGGERAAAALLAALDDEESEVRRKAVRAVAEIQGKNSLEVLLGAAGSDAFDVRSAAAGALGALGGERALEALTALLRDESGCVRGAAAEALGRLGDERAAAALVKACGDADVYVRGLAVAALGQVGGEPALEALLPALRDENLYVRIRAAAALGQVGGGRATEGLVGAVGDEDFDVRVTAADSLTRIGGGRASEILFLEGSYKSADERWRFYAKLAWTKVERDAAKLAPAMEDEGAGPAAADALGRTGGEQAVAPLLAALASRHAEVRKRAAASLAKIGREELGRGLLKALSYGDEFVRRRAAEAVAYYRDDETTFEQLSVLAFMDEAEEVRAAAADALGKLTRRLEYMGGAVPGFTLARARE